jgi:succinate dehydrogenase/fumarate reductase flavoprotein subunit
MKKNPKEMKDNQPDMTRRAILKGAASLGLMASAGAVGLAASAKDAVAAGMPKKWDVEADVVILGLGGAGTCAAIEAADAGARVIVLEKQPQNNLINNTRMSGGIFHCPDPTGDPEALKAYAKAMFSGENLPTMLEGEQPDVSDGLAEAWARYSPGNLDFLKKLDPAFNGVAFSRFSGAAFPTFPGAKESKYRVFGSSFKNKADFDIPTKDLPKADKMNGEAFFAVLREAVEKRKVRILWETPARRLIMNDKGEVIGVMGRKKDGGEVACKAKRGVIVTTGGYEYSLPMRRAFLEGPGVEGWAFYGSPENTGDGIAIGMQAGAALAKVGKAASRIIMAVPIRHHGLKMGLITDSVGGPNSIVIDNYGNRYAAETLVTTDPSRYFFYKEAVKFDITKLIYPRVPSRMVFDEAFRSKVTITSLGISTAGFGFVPWTKDNLDAIKRGWILQADTLEALAAKIMNHKENRKLMEAANLSQTVGRFNEFCKKGKDEDFGRRPGTMGPIDKPPFYALPLYAGGPNTKGGIAANAKREVLNWEGKPIPRLFTAGEISSALKFVYQGGGNLTECIVFGRIAGRNAAALKPWK